MIRRLASGFSSSGGIRLGRDIIRATAGDALNVELHIRPFVVPVASKASSPRNAYRKVRREERQALVESFVEKFRAANNGKFPGIDFTRREVGGSYYVIREIILQLKCQPKASCDHNRKVSLGQASTGSLEVDQDFCDGNIRILNSEVSTIEERAVSEDASAEKENFVSIAHSSKLFTDETPKAEGVTSSEAASSTEQSCNTDFYSVQDADSSHMNDFNSVKNANGFNTNNTVVDKTERECHSPDNLPFKIDQDLCQQSRIVHSNGASTAEETPPPQEHSMTENSQAGASVSSNNIETKGLPHSGASTCDASSHKNVKEELQQDFRQDSKSNDSGRNLDGRPNIKEAFGTTASVWSNIKSLAVSIMKFWRQL